MVEASYVRHIGLSEVGAETVRRAVATHPISDLQIEYSLISRGIEAEILPTCEELPAPERLRRWLDLLVESKQSRARDDPELFAAYVQGASESREVITEHVATLVAQLAGIIADGAEEGAFAVADASSAARAVFDATARFHNPANAGSWTDRGIEMAYEEVVALVLAGLRAGPQPY